MARTQITFAFFYLTKAIPTELFNRKTPLVFVRIHVPSITLDFKTRHLKVRYTAPRSSLKIQLAKPLLVAWPNTLSALTPDNEAP